MTPERQRPEDFLELVERAKRGRLKVYLGFAAGVGKTYRMLEEAHAMRRRGVDVAIGIVETHGRAETAALIDGLEQVPKKRFEYRDVVVEDMDLDAVIARNPKMAIVDEVAHTNAPGMRNRKRYQDILELLRAGVNVVCAFNVQHLESLNDLVARATGVTVRETVPDSFLKQADQVVTLDLAVEDLLERLRTGRIYPTDKVEWALAHFFRDENLATLRELVLREVAESVERAATVSARGENSPATRKGTGRIMVCISSNSPRAPVLLRRGSRMAGRLNTDWYVAYVQTPDESPELIDATAQRHLHANTQMARELGAEVVRLKGRDPVAALLDFARSHNVRHIVVGRTDRPWWRRILGQDVVWRLVESAAGFDVQIVSFDEQLEEPA